MYLHYNNIVLVPFNYICRKPTELRRKYEWFYLILNTKLSLARGIKRPHGSISKVKHAYEGRSRWITVMKSQNLQVLTSLLSCIQLDWKNHNKGGMVRLLILQLHEQVSEMLWSGTKVLKLLYLLVLIIWFVSADIYCNPYKDRHTHKAQCGNI